MRAQNAAAACPAFFSKGTLHVAHHPPPTHLRMDPLCARSTLSVISHTRRNTPSTPDTPKPSTTFWVSLREGRTNREVGLHPWPAFPRRRLWCRPWAAPSPSWRAARLPQPTSPAAGGRRGAGAGGGPPGAGLVWSGLICLEAVEMLIAAAHSAVASTYCAAVLHLSSL